IVEIDAVGQTGPDTLGVVPDQRQVILDQLIPQFNTRLGAVVAPNLRNIHIHMRHHGLLPAVRQVVYRSRPKLAPRAVRTPPLSASAPWLGERIGRGCRTAVRPDAPRPGRTPAGVHPIRPSAAGAAHRVEDAGEPAHDAIAVLVGMLAGHRSL